MSIDRAEFTRYLLQWEREGIPLEERRQLLLEIYDMRMSVGAIEQLTRMAPRGE